MCDIVDALLVGKYSALRDWLRASGKQAVTVSFDELADIIPGGLPPSAYNYRPWWGNETSPGRPQCSEGWMAAGYLVVHVDRGARFVAFRLATES